ncbi:MAG: hypothetical protein DHS20C01_27850 [marine bacterium B5-7]|nr:MAG: hypothetical protein DHS20C01_27850 [marine bacterium B5-7]
MSSSLSAEQVASYHRDGFLFPLRAMPSEDAARLRIEIERIEAMTCVEGMKHSLNQYFRVNAQIVLPCVARLAANDTLVDAVESMLGPDILVWSAELFIKEPHSSKHVSWHQDLTYWGLGETEELVTAWLALSPATEASGCMRFVAGSHLQPIVPHIDTFESDNLLSRGQELAVDVDEADAVSVVLEPGEFSLHHGRMYHSSCPNVSEERRIGIAIRYVTPGVKQQVGERDYAMLVRGIDEQHNWINIAAPTQLFSDYSLALYDRILGDQSAALAQGAHRSVNLYSNPPD